MRAEEIRATLLEFANEQETFSQKDAENATVSTNHTVLKKSNFWPKSRFLTTRT